MEARGLMATATVGSAVDLDVSVAERLVAHIRQQSTDMVDAEMRVPRDHFTSPERAQAEIALLKSRPLIVAHVSELPEPGDFITRDFWGASVIITRTKSGEIRAYRNMCAHRGGRVEQKDSGKKHIFMCQYHGWSYNAEDGSLRPLSYEKTFGEVDYPCSGLAKIKTEVRYGLVFLDLSNDPDRTLDDFLGPDVEAQLAPWAIEKSRIHIDETFVLPINWKLVMDGAVDSLHAQYLHPGPGNVGARTLTNVAVFERFGDHGRLFTPRTRLKKLVDSGEPLEATTRYLASIMLLYPNALIAAAPDHIEFWTVWPSANPAETTIRIRFFVREEVMSPEIEERVNKSWDILRNAAVNEDWPMEVWIQQNATEWPDGDFRYGRNEVSAQHLHGVLARDLERQA